MARRRFFVEALEGDRAILTGRGAEHLRRVLRAEPGRVFEVTDGNSAFLAEIASLEKGRVMFHLLEPVEAVELPVKLILLASLIKFDRFEWMVEKATELGVSQIVPVEAARSERGLRLAAEKRLERWRRIAVESSQQARRLRAPEIQPVLSFKQAAAAGGGLRLLLNEERGCPPLIMKLQDSCKGWSGNSMVVMSGPEGGWTESERELADAAGWSPVSLGPHILRAETAAIAALAVASAWASALPPAARDAPGGYAGV